MQSEPRFRASVLIADSTRSIVFYTMISIFVGCLYVTRCSRTSLIATKMTFVVSVNFLSAKKFGTIQAVFALLKMGTLVVLSLSNHSSLALKS